MVPIIRILAGVFVLAAGRVCAGPVEDVIVAAMRLTEQPNYTWTTAVADDARSYDIDGVHRRPDYSRVKMPVVNTLRRKLGRDVTDNRVDAVFRGNVACVLNTANGWKTPAELPEPHEDDEEFERVVSPTGPTGVTGSKSLSGGVLKGTTIRRTRPNREADEAGRPYSNLQLAISLPHEELGVIVTSHRDLVIEGDTASGHLTEVGAQLLLVRDGQPEITPIRATGKFKLWVRAGFVTRYHLQLEGTLSVVTPRGRAHVTVTQNSTTQIRDIGTTKVEIPPEAFAKLSR